MLCEDDVQELRLKHDVLIGLMVQRLVGHQQLPTVHPQAAAFAAPQKLVSPQLVTRFRPDPPLMSLVTGNPTSLVAICRRHCGSSAPLLVGGG